MQVWVLTDNEYAFCSVHATYESAYAQLVYDFNVEGETAKVESDYAPGTDTNRAKLTVHSSTGRTYVFHALRQMVIGLPYATDLATATNPNEPNPNE